jgi:hypothetical protein
MSEPQAQPASGRNMIGIVIVGVAALLLIIAYVIVLKGFSREGEKRSSYISDKESAGPDNIEVNVNVASVDPVKGDLTARITFEPHGTMAKDELTPAEDLTLIVNSATGKAEHKFEKGKRMNPVDVTISLDGQANDYPFDVHDAELVLLLTTPVKVKPAEPHAATDEESGTAKPPTQTSMFDTNEPVPMAVEFSGSIPGFKLDAAKDKESEAGLTIIEMNISRASTVVFFSVFGMALMLSLASAAVFMMLRFLLAKRKVELAAMSFYGAMLFAFPALRNSQPGVPPLGTYSDFVAFFWAEALVAISLLIVATLWVIRRPS